MGNSKERIPLQRVDTNRWCIPKQYNAEMHVPGMNSADPGRQCAAASSECSNLTRHCRLLAGHAGHSLGLRLSCGRSGGDLR